LGKFFETIKGTTGLKRVRPNPLNRQILGNQTPGRKQSLYITLAS
jgi:hypothetical protein